MYNAYRCVAELGTYFRLISLLFIYIKKSSKIFELLLIRVI
jgi:hypothetical protein